jgi:predicted GNAT superfamily acetyltransferase
LGAGEAKGAPLTRAEIGHIVVRHCSGLAEFEACLALEREVWSSQDVDVVPSSMFVVAQETGGQVLGAFDLDAGGAMVGFTLAVAALHGERRYIHSHMTAVREDYRNRGVGRMLKLFQRQDALERGIELVEWTFDPLELRNAHFNLVRLGAVVRRYRPNIYGITTSPLHAGMPTDRFVAEWWLDSPRVRSRLNEPAAGVEPRAARGPASVAEGGGLKSAPAVARVDVPRDIDDIRKRNVSEAIAVQSRLRERIQQLFAQGFVITGIEFTKEQGSYLLERHENPETLSA